MKELDEAKKRNCMSCMDDLYQLLNPEENEGEFEMTVLERKRNIIQLIWIGEDPDIRDIKHHASRCVKWIILGDVENRRSSKFCFYCKKFCGHDAQGCKKYQRRYGKRSPRPIK